MRYCTRARRGLKGTAQLFNLFSHHTSPNSRLLLSPPPSSFSRKYNLREVSAGLVALRLSSLSSANSLIEWLANYTHIFAACFQTPFNPLHQLSKSKADFFALGQSGIVKLHPELVFAKVDMSWYLSAIRIWKFHWVFFSPCNEITLISLQNPIYKRVNLYTRFHKWFSQVVSENVTFFAVSKKVFYAAQFFFSMVCTLWYTFRSRRQD